ncbi:polysaccharide deacetylase family protein [Knoellia sinensis]|uniref:polysaccharide deacetylase family protein n=1 Tax=Knoellia sinensis TaxID=136100 RepID=UPI00146FD3E9|nr:polysaccharide deacetylase family protein [Knoellia sinensis]
MGFHGVEDLERFGVLIDAICDRYQPVGESEVAAALIDGVPLPAHAVWITFDDGLASTFEAGPLLAARHVSATAFVCPRVLDDGGWLWFQAAQAALDRDELIDVDGTPLTLQQLKGMDDVSRRRVHDRIAESLEAQGVESPTPVTTVTLGEWLDMGHTIGNHTWDHPCLDKCSPSSQVDQMRRAHRALAERGFRPRFFAYPNGNWTPEAAAEAEALGYVGSLLFDHRLSSVSGDPHRISRLRIDSDATLDRTLSILSGAHSAAFQVVAR